jgi:hypothetical protein
MRSGERQKLTSAWLNIIAAGVVSGGIASQLAAAGSPGRQADAVMSLTIIVLSTTAGSLIHLLARWWCGADDAK